MKNLKKLPCMLIFITLIATQCLAMYQKFVPSKETCGAAADKTNVPDSISTRLKCMIAGFKDLYWGSEIELDDLKEKERKAIKDADIKTIIVKGNILGDPIYGNTLLLYTKKGENNARLLAHYDKIRIESANEVRMASALLEDKKATLLKDMLVIMDKYIEKSSERGADDLEVMSLAEEMKNINFLIKDLNNKIKINQSKLYSDPNHYLIGVLLGYDPEDIKYFYDNKVDVPGQFEIDKVLAEQFIEENS